MAEAPRDRDTQETASAIRVFEKAYGWAKLVGGITTGLAAVLIAGAAYQSFNLRRTVGDTLAAVSAAKGAAEKQIHETAATTSSEIVSESVNSVEAIRAAAKKVHESSKQAEIAANQQSNAITHQADQVRRDFQGQAAAVTKDVDLARQQIQTASQLQPQMQSLQEQLKTAQEQIQEQQKVLTSSEDFAKKVFSSRKQFVFDLKTMDKSKFCILDASTTDDLVVLYLLLPDVPVAGTLQPQFFQIVAAPNSFASFHNLAVLYIQKAAKEELLGKQISISYFPDSADKTLIGTLAIKDGRVFADGEGLPKFGQSDPEFKGSKWTTALQDKPTTN